MSHAKLSPSAAVRWLNCPGSIRLSAGIPDKSSPAAEEGTKAHDLAERALLNGTNTGRYSSYPQEMREYIQQYVDYVRSFPGKLKVEQRVDLTEWIPGGFGTADVVLKDGDTLHVMDLKYGMNKVDAKKNPQAMLYALGSLRNKTKAVCIHICQPRLDHWDCWWISASKLRKWGEKIKPKAALCLTEDAPLNPGEKTCQWCPAAPTCPALHNHALETVGGDFETLPAVEDLTPEQLATVVLNEKLITGFISKIKAHAEGLLEAGTAVPGLKLVESNTRRRYTEDAPEAMRAMIGELAFREPELITISAAEKLIGKGKFEELGITEKPRGKITVAPENDRRPAVTPSIDDFDSE